MTSRSMKIHAFSTTARAFLAVAVLLIPECALPQPSEEEQHLWSTIKQALLSPSGDDYFESSLRNSLLPPLYGTVVAATQEDDPGTIVLALSNRESPEVTLRLVKKSDRGFVGSSFGRRIRPGDGIRFQGIPVNYEKAPFNLIFDVEVDRLKHNRQ